jgi:hypothetical protein
MGVRLKRLYTAGNGLTERRRSRTDRAWGCHTAQVLKTCWATGPMPLRCAGYRGTGLYGSTKVGHLLVEGI